MRSQTIANFLVVFLGALGGFWQFYLKPRLDIIGYGRQIQSINNDYCKKVPQLPACESKGPFYTRIGKFLDMLLE